MEPLLHALFVALVLWLPGGGDEELERARQLLAANEEADCTKGMELCVQKNNLAAVELLLDVLRQEADRALPVAHYRDVCWDGLRRIGDTEGRKRVETELAKNKKDPLVRQWCAELLGEYGDRAFALSLIVAMEDKDLGVQRAAARALGKLRHLDEDLAVWASACQSLGKKVKDKDTELRAFAIEAIARLDSKAGQAGLLEGLKDKDAGVRCLLLGVGAELYLDRGEELAAAALKDADWRPRLEAVDVLGGIKSPSALRHLIDALGDARPAVTARAVRHLQELTGQKHTKKEAWEQWWQENGADFDFSKGRKKEARTADSTVAATFNGITFESDHTAFLIDVSGTMSARLKTVESSKAAAARKELDETLTRLQGRLSFSLFAYADEVRPFAKKGAVELNPKTQAKALEFVDEQGTQGSKNIWAALESVLADPSIDTVFLLSSGEPEVGLYVHWSRVTWHLKELNRFRRVVVHAIAYSDSKGYRGQLERIAEATGGEFRFVE
ncbi:MAG: hypothetical protein EXS08_11940 [Planctomycetes bacterium]|nr:hypothetical protein [Planctomycetota bacterium]